MFGPAVQPWYYSWSLAIAALFLLDWRAISILGGLSIALVVMIRPNGSGLQLNPAVIAIIVGGLLLSWIVIEHRVPRFRRQRADAR
jgi:alpha-1,6-mannosyltransferase